MRRDVEPGMVVCPRCGRSFDEARFCPVDGAALGEVRPSGVVDPMVGATIGDVFAIDGVLGRGAGGVVYAATQTDLARPVAVKVLAAELARWPKNVARFEREARALARVEHPGVVAIYAIGRVDDGRPFLAMERLAGRTLEAELAAGPLPPARAVAIARQIAAALAAVHAAELVHRDLKPSNVMLGPGDRAVLLDFGVVKQGGDVTKLTAGGEALGTPHYMAPEQATGDGVDARTDLYALGAMLYRMITGAVPFDGNGMQVMMAHVGRPAPRLAAAAPHAGAALDAIVARCLAKRQDDRFASAAELEAALAAAAAELEGMAARDAMGHASTAVAADGIEAIALGEPDDGGGDGGLGGGDEDDASDAAPTRISAPRVSAQQAHAPRVSAPQAHAPRPSAQQASAPQAHAPREIAPPAPAPRRGRDDTDVRDLLPPRPGPRIALAALALAAIAAVVLVVWPTGARPTGAVAAGPDAPAGPSLSTPGELLPAPTGAVIVESDGFAMKVTLPRLVVGRDADLELEIWDEAGAPVVGAETIVTVAAPSGAATGLRAREHAAGVYRFRVRLDEPGPHVLRVFLPRGDATLTVPLDVAKDPSAMS